MSVRDANFAPVVNQAIDMFYISAANEAKAFKDDGTCQTGQVRIGYSYTGEAAVETITAWWESSTSSTSDSPDITKPGSTDAVMADGCGVSTGKAS